MIPELFRIWNLSISPFGPLLVAAFLAAYFQLRHGFAQRGIGDEEDASAVFFAAAIGGILGAKIYYAILYQDWRLLFDRSGLVWYGGFILASILILWTLRRRRLPLDGSLDVASLSLAVGYGIGRIGCFLVGDDYGVPTDLPWGVAFPQGLPPTTAFELERLGAEIPPGIAPQELLRVHPTQIYETLAALSIWWIGRRYFKTHPRAGNTALLVLGALAVERFLVEFLRAKDDRFFGVLTLAQVISLCLIALFAFLAWRRRRREA